MQVGNTVMDDYILGILWSIGSLVKEGYSEYFVVRHKDRYYSDFLKEAFKLTKSVYPIQEKTKKYYCIKIPYDFVREILEENGWVNRWGEERSYPIYVENHADFLRAYLEIHSSLDYCTSYSGKRKYYRLRWRIYGNQKLIEQINEILYIEIGITSHKPQSTVNEKTTYLSLTNLQEIKKIIEYIEGEPKSANWWEEVEEYLSNPKLNSLK